MTRRAWSGKQLLFPLLLLYGLFCIPLALTVYTPWAYQTYCHWNERCERLGEPVAQQAMHDIAQFFRHQRPTLDSPWSVKETQHMLEVRGMYDVIFSVFGLILLLFLIDIWCVGSLHQYLTYAQHSLYLAIGLLLLALVIAPIFNSFWMQVFHPLLFDNDLWRTDPNDISWYLMPKRFFLWVILFLVLTTLLLNWALVRLLRRLDLKTY